LLPDFLRYRKEINQQKRNYYLRLIKQRVEKYKNYFNYTKQLNISLIKNKE